MAQKPTTTRNLDSDVAKELEQALDIDLTGSDGDLDIAASMEDLEAQISQAADELARESAKTKVAPAPDAAPKPQASAQNNTKPQNTAKAPAKPAAEWHPSAPSDQAPLQPGGFQPANVNYGLFPPLPKRASRGDRRAAHAARARADLTAWATAHGFDAPRDLLERAG